MSKYFWFLSFALISLPSFAQEEWKLEKDKNGIQVYTRPRAGYEIREFKSVTEINTPSNKVLETVLNADSFDQWMKDIKNSKIIRDLEDGQILTYYQIEVPWPLQNRDAIGDMRLIESDDQYRIDITVLPEYLPEYPKLVRMRDAKGFWIIKSLDETSCTVTYQFVADPEGSIPGWIANMFIVDGPYQTLLNLKNRLE